MNYQTARQRFDDWDRREGRSIFTRSDLSKLFPEDSPKTLQEGINRMRRQGLLEGVARGIYVYALARTSAPYRLEGIARAMRRGEYSYISLESALSEYGAISQIPVDRLTIMTTGRKGIYRTPYGTIEFTHTRRAASRLLERTRDIGRPLRLATPEAAWADLKRVGRNTHLVNTEALAGD
jgi:predicted transcriptional regulator of viral defense system